MKTINVEDASHKAIKLIAANNETSMTAAVQTLIDRAEWAGHVASLIHQIGSALPINSPERKLAESLAMTSPFTVCQAADIAATRQEVSL